MSLGKLPVFFHPDVLSMKAPDGLFEKAPSPLLAHQMTIAENPERIENIKSLLERAPSADYFDWRDGRHASDAEILRFHDSAYLDDLKSWNENGHWATATTYLPKSGLGALRAAAGTALEALEAILDDEAGRAYALLRPPSHHAARATADGYCFVNSVAIAAETARLRGLERIAVVDWDVHHGNGTQAGFYDRDDVFVISMHMDHGAWGESHPQTGGVDEIGSGDGRGYNLNLPLPLGAGDHSYIEIVDNLVVPALDRFEPGLIIVSNGQDASQFDPNGRQSVTMAGFHRIACQLSAAAGRLCEGKLLIAQEGGYNLAYTAFCAYAAALGFLERPLDLEDPLAFYPEDLARSAALIDQLVASHPLLDAAGNWMPGGG